MILSPNAKIHIMSSPQTFNRRNLLKSCQHFNSANLSFPSSEHKPEYSTLPPSYLVQAETVKSDPSTTAGNAMNEDQITLVIPELHSNALTIQHQLTMKGSTSHDAFRASRQISSSSIGTSATYASDTSVDGSDHPLDRNQEFSSHQYSLCTSQITSPHRLDTSQLPTQDSSVSINAILRETGGTSSSTPNATTPPRSTLCQCPCRNCATCPLRAICHNKKRDQNSNTRNDPDHLLHNKRCGNRSESVWSRMKTAIISLCLMEAEEDPIRFKYDCRVIPEHPLPKGKQRLLEVTELPFLILWVYFTYWLVIATVTARYAPCTIWLSAVIASVLVGLGLNANAYKSVTVPRRRGSIRHHRHARALMEMRKYGESIDTVEMKIDWGMVIRFFIIPFGVTSLSGLTNSNRDDFLLVFPRDPYYLMAAILCPAVIVTCLSIVRILLLWHLKVRWSLQVLFLNGALVD